MVNDSVPLTVIILNIERSSDTSPTVKTNEHDGPDSRDWNTVQSGIKADDTTVFRLRTIVKVSVSSNMGREAGT